MAIEFFKLGWHGLTVFGMAVRICQRHGHGEDAKTVPPNVGNGVARIRDIRVFVRGC